MASTIGIVGKALANPAVGQGLLGVAGSVFGSRQQHKAQGETIRIFETQAASARAAADFNANLERLKSDRRQEQFAREAALTNGRQKVEIATTNLSVTSKSFLQVQNETISQFTNAMLQERVDSTQREKVIRFEGERTAQDLMARARAARTRQRTTTLSNALNIGTQAFKLGGLIAGQIKSGGK